MGELEALTCCEKLGLSRQRAMAWFIGRKRERRWRRAEILHPRRQQGAPIPSLQRDPGWGAAPLQGEEQCRAGVPCLMGVPARRGLPRQPAGKTSGEGACSSLTSQPHCPGAGGMPGLAVGVTGSEGTVGLQRPQPENWDLTRDRKADGRARTSKEMCVCRDTRPMSRGSPACASCPERSPAAAWGVSVAVEGRQRGRWRWGFIKPATPRRAGLRGEG